MNGVGGIILAAGKSSRMGKPKLLQPLLGKEIIRWVVDSVQESKVIDIVVITGKYKNDIEKVLKKNEIRTVYNPDYYRGMSTSLKKGVKHINSKAKGFLFVMGDQPLITVEAINIIIDEYYRKKALIVAPLYEGKRVNPVIFDRAWENELFKLNGDIGARELIKNNKAKVSFIEMKERNIPPEAFWDIDSEADYMKIKMKTKG